MIEDSGGGGREGGNGVRSSQSKKPISCNDEPSSDGPQTKQTKQPIRWIVRDIPRLSVCVPMRAHCVVNSSHNTDTAIPGRVRERERAREKAAVTRKTAVLTSREIQPQARNAL